ncbi:hypothetical protein FSARC_2577 [Fusarium sarcochroum]|uniref:DASH complex subunit DAM1 n=1 Tax=Fusarium sarcochroum TaxID=1208366 RepID=A0A8H4XDQ0_9HYPO|nr:hypothetical protein FSARC_2577 [Fusarium sarcochroum]
MSNTPLDASKRSNSRSRTSRPTTPLRPSSRSSFRESARGAGENDAPFPLNTFEPAFAELSDAMADLEANMMHFQLMHESLARFSESFASFLYGLNMNAFCVDFPENLRHDNRVSLRLLVGEHHQEEDLPGESGEAGLVGLPERAVEAPGEHDVGVDTNTPNAICNAIKSKSSPEYAF